MQDFPLSLPQPPGPGWEDFRVNPAEKLNDLTARCTGEGFDDIELRGREVVEDREVADPEVVVLEAQPVHRVLLPVTLAPDGEDGEPVFSPA